jgi:hypothetical protein
MHALLLLLIVLSTMFLAGCGVVAGIFKMGMFLGVVLVLLVLGGLVYFVTRAL